MTQFVTMSNFFGFCFGLNLSEIRVDIIDKRWRLVRVTGNKERYHSDILI